MVRRRAPLTALATALLLVIAAAGTAAARPSFQGGACWTGSEVQLSIDSSGIRSDGYSFGVGDASGAGFGFVQDTAVTKEVHETWNFTPAGADTVVAGGDVLWHGHSRAGFTVNEPAGGWNTLPGC
jgi:hypothetical protein